MESALRVFNTEKAGTVFAMTLGMVSVEDQVELVVCSQMETQKNQRG